MNQEQPLQQPSDAGTISGLEMAQPSRPPVWTPPKAGQSWSKLPGINQWLFAASFGCLGVGGFALIGPPLADATRVAYHPYTGEGKRETCLSNLQSIAGAISLYAQDNSGRLPLVEMQSGKASVTWVTSLTPHVTDSKSWVCPMGPGEAQGSATYALNPVLAGGPLSGADDAAATLLIGDGSAAGALALQPPYPGWSNAGNPTQHQAGLAFHHDGAAGVVYADGHAGTLGPSGINEAALWGGSAASRASLERIAGRNAGSQALVTTLRTGDEAATTRLLRTNAPNLAAASRDLLTLWGVNAQAMAKEAPGGDAATTASQSVDAVGWNLAWAWQRLGQGAALKQLEAQVKTQAAAELERVEVAGLQTRPDPSGGTLDAPQGWTSDETAEGNYRTLNLRSRVPGLFLYVEVGTRSTSAASPIPIDWRGAELRLQAKYGAGYRRLSMGRSTLGEYPAGVWEYELDKPGGPRLHKRLIGMVNGWNSTVFATTTPRGSFGIWKTTFERISQSL